MAYFGPSERVRGQLGEIAQQRVEGVRYWAGLGAYIKGPEQITAEAAEAKNLGYDGVALFSLGHLLRKPEGVAPYAAALHGRRADPARRGRPPQPRSHHLSGDLATLYRIVTTAGAGATVPAAKLETLLRSRLGKLQKARDRGFAAALATLRDRPVTPPPRVELHGIFRYVHPLDPPETRQQQKSGASNLRDRLLAGADFETLAREHSQGGSKRLGGPMGRRYLDLARPEDAALAQLAPAAISPVIPVENGYWLYRIDTKGQDASADWDTLPWPARRILFRQVLNERMR
jgi:hypothetical protein